MNWAAEDTNLRLNRSWESIVFQVPDNATDIPNYEKEGF